MLAYAMRWPNDEVYLFGVMPVKVKWLVAILAVANVVAGIQGGQRSNGVAYLAHLGGLAAGWLYLRTSSGSGGIERIGNHVAQTPDYPDEMPRAVPKSAPRAKEKSEDIDELSREEQGAQSDAAIGTDAAKLPTQSSAPRTDEQSGSRCWTRSRARESTSLTQRRSSMSWKMPRENSATGPDPKRQRSEVKG